MKNSVTGFTISILLLLFGIHCSQQQTEWEGTIEEIDGVRIVKNPEFPLRPEMRVVFEEELTVGREEDNENYMFGNAVASENDYFCVKRYQYEIQ